MVMGKHRFNKDPAWSLNGSTVENVNQMEILGCTFSNSCESDKHTEKRLQKCRQSFFSLADIGMSYPGLDSPTKSYLWKTICAPTLVYGYDAISLRNSDLKSMKSLQGTLLKKAKSVRTILVF